MKLTQTIPSLIAIGLAALTGLGTAQAQSGSQSEANLSDGPLSLNASMPSEVRTGESFEYEIQVQNKSDNIALHQIVLSQAKAKGFSVESMKLESEMDKNKKKSGKNNKSKQKNKSDKQSSNKSSSKASGNSDSSQQNQSDSKESSDSAGEITIKKLMPGQSDTVMVKATADKEGSLKACLEIKSYKPAICLTSQVVKPDLELTKKAPEKSNICKMIELQYTVKNNGSGDVGKFEIVDKLGKGLSTIEGKDKLSFDIDGLTAGETRQFVARVYAKNSGTFSSRATAKAKNSDLKSRSSETTTKVVATELDVRVNGPNKIYNEEPVTFNAEVTNTGNAPANDVQLTVQWPDAVSFVDMSDPEISKSDESSSDDSDNQSSTSGEPTVASSGSASASSSKSGKSNKKSDMEMTSEEMSISQLKPGETATFSYTVRPGDADEIPTRVKAMAICAVDQAQDESAARSKTTATAMARTKVQRLPAMQLLVVDDEDPVPNGSNVTYTIRVWNEGDAPAKNVQLTAKLPEGLQFKEADGPTDATSEGQTVSFGELKTVEAGDRLDYRLTATSKGSGSVLLEVELESESLDKNVKSDEPTRLYSGQVSN